MWNSLSPRVKTVVVSLLGVLVVGGLAFGMFASANQYVDLYATRLSNEDVKQISMKLTDLNYPHKVAVTGDQILIHPRYKSKAQIQLAAYGLPRHPVVSYQYQQGGMGTQTHEEKKEYHRRVLEGELTEAIRQVEGVADAYVKLVIPDERLLFKDESAPAKAAVMVKLQPTARLSPDQIKGIVHLVSFSVPDLEPENVKVVDTRSRDLTAGLPLGEEAQIAGAMPVQQADYKRQIERDLTEKVQAALDKVLGPGNTVATVNAEIDFSQLKKTRKKVGGPADQGKVQVIKMSQSEAYNKDGEGDGEGGARQLSDSSGAARKSSDYAQEQIKEKWAYDETLIEEIRNNPELRRLTCSVVVNNLQEDMKAAVAGIVKDAIGIDESRGDSLTVASMPFNQAPLSDPIFTQMGAALESGATPRPVEGYTVTPQQMLMGAGAVAAFFLALIAVFMVRSRQAQQAKSQLILETSAGAPAAGIADLLNEKSGKSKPLGETRVNTTDQLEKLAKERPTKVAELLKSTWLSGGGGN